jgi:hypothetical protein
VQQIGEPDLFERRLHRRREPRINPRRSIAIRAVPRVDIGAPVIPFGADITGGASAIDSAAQTTGLEQEEVWFAAGSGVLGLAWPKTRQHMVQIRRELATKDVAGERIHVYRRPFGKVAM